MAGRFGGGCLLSGRLSRGTVGGSTWLLLLPWLESEVLRSTFESVGFFLPSSSSLEDGSALRMLPLGVLTRGAGGSLLFGWPNCLSFVFPFFNEWSFLTLVLSELSFRTEVALCRRQSSTFSCFGLRLPFSCVRVISHPLFLLLQHLALFLSNLHWCFAHGLPWYPNTRIHLLAV